MCRRLDPPQELTAALALDGLAAIARRQGDLAAAEAAYAESCELFQRHLGDEPQGFANALQGRAVVQRDRGNLAAAKSGLRQGIDRLVGLGGTEPQIAQARRLLAKLERMPESPPL
jgi:ATP/maltotriose-dependent transcriptional regulator MalT